MPAPAASAWSSCPHGGGTFPESLISEPGRLRLLQLLDALSDAQLTDLFTGSGATAFDAVNGEGRSRAGVGRGVQGQGPADPRRQGPVRAQLVRGRLTRDDARVDGRFRCG